MSTRRPISIFGCLLLALSATLLAADPPVANDDYGAAARSGDTTIDVLANDTPATGLTIASATEPKSTDPDTLGAAAGLAIVSNGKIIYRPSGIAETATFDYVVNDVDGGTDTGTVHIIATPVAKSDNAFLGNGTVVRIAVLKNDKKDKARIQIKSVTKPRRGTAKVNEGEEDPEPNPVDDEVIYRAGEDFAGHDSFTYTIGYDFGPTSSATVTVFAPGAVFQGPLGANITDTEGNIIGYIRLNATATGAFSGKVQIGTEVYSLLGALDAKGKFVGYAHSEDNDILALSLAVKNASGGAELRATFGGSDEWTVTQKIDTLTTDGLKTLEGRYTVELAAADVPRTSDGSEDGSESDSGGGGLPQGIGWMTIEVNEYGNSTIEGRTGDGRSFSTEGQIVGTDSEPELPFMAAWDDSVLAGTLKMGETVEGDLRWILYPNDEDRYPGGFDVTIPATGSFYTEPEDGVRVLASDTNDSGRVTISISGGGADEFSREMRLSEDDDVSPIIEGPDEIEFEIDRDNGIFKGKFRDLDDRERRIKFTGVLLQGESRGVGHFEGDDKTGRVEISVATETDDGIADGIDLGTL